jgi:hypothetical protein
MQVRGGGKGGEREGERGEGKGGEGGGRVMQLCPTTSTPLQERVAQLVEYFAGILCPQQRG